MEKKRKGQWNSESVSKLIKKMVDERKSIIERSVENEHVFISPVNKKGAPRSVSTIPVFDCTNCKKCMLDCYDVKHDCIQRTVRHTRAVNSAIYSADPERYFNEISECQKSMSAFRWHVGGDIKNLDYFCGMMRVAKENPQCVQHIFTKNYDAVNVWIDRYGKLPENVSLRFSTWPDLPCDNRHGLNTCDVVFEDSFVITDENTALCTGNCTDCAISRSGCFDREIKTVYIIGH